MEEQAKTDFITADHRTGIKFTKLGDSSVRITVVVADCVVFSREIDRGTWETVVSDMATEGG